MYRIFLVSLLTIALAGAVNVQVFAVSQTAAAEKTKAEVLKVDEERNQSLRKDDVAALDRMYADGLVFTTQTGKLLDKAQVLAIFRSKTLAVSVLRHDDIRVHMYGNTAVITGRSTSDLEYEGKHSSRPRIFTNVYVKQNRRWLLVVHNETPVLEP